jgi:hypothetical protein
MVEGLSSKSKAEFKTQYHQKKKKKQQQQHTQQYYSRVKCLEYGKCSIKICSFIFSWEAVLCNGNKVRPRARKILLTTV